MTPPGGGASFFQCFWFFTFFTCFVFSDFVCFRSSGRPPGVSPPGGLRPHRLPDSRNPRFFCDLFFGNLCALFLMVGQWDRLCYSVGPLRCFAGCGTRLPFILFMLSFIHSVHSVCIHCKDSIPGCTGGNNCPTISDVNTNAQLFSTNSLGSIPKTTNLLPAWGRHASVPPPCCFCRRCAAGDG